MEMASSNWLERSVRGTAWAGADTDTTCRATRSRTFWALSPTKNLASSSGLPICPLRDLSWISVRSPTTSLDVMLMTVEDNCHRSFEMERQYKVGEALWKGDCETPRRVLNMWVFNCDIVSEGKVPSKARHEPCSNRCTIRIVSMEGSFVAFSKHCKRSSCAVAGSAISDGSGRAKRDTAAWVYFVLPCRMSTAWDTRRPSKVGSALNIAFRSSRLHATNVSIACEHHKQHLPKRVIICSTYGHCGKPSMRAAANASIRHGQEPAHECMSAS